MNAAYHTYLRAYSLILGGGGLCSPDVIKVIREDELVAMAIGVADARCHQARSGEEYFRVGPKSAAEFSKECARSLGLDAPTAEAKP